VARGPLGVVFGDAVVVPMVEPGIGEGFAEGHRLLL
jgi:hypothetical protein